MKFIILVLILLSAFTLSAIPATISMTLIIAGMGIWDICMIIFVIKNFKLSFLLNNLKKFRNLCLILLSCFVTGFTIYSFTSSIEVWRGIFMIETTVWVWIQALFSD